MISWPILFCYYYGYRLAFDEDRVPDLTSEIYLQDVHSISSLLKMYFRELPNPLLTYQLYDKFAVSQLVIFPSVKKTWSKKKSWNLAEVAAIKPQI